MSQTEREFIAAIRRQPIVEPGRLVYGIGDDCAVYRLDDQGLSSNFGIITTDALVESVHFDLSWHPPRLLGRKALSVNISDIAAMGGKPTFALLTVGFCKESGSNLLESFMAGFYEVLTENSIQLIGGDTVKSASFFVSVTLLGEVDKAHVLYRSGANVGDLVWVSGPLGRAAAGLEISRRSLQFPGIDLKLRAAHLDPRARAELGPLLAASGFVTAMMDISDGIATDLAHICQESSVGAELYGDMLPISSQVKAVAREMECSAVDWSVKGGEDYELLFTSSPADRDSLLSLIKQSDEPEIYCVGRIVEGDEVKIQLAGEKTTITYEGFDHFTGPPSV